MPTVRVLVDRKDEGVQIEGYDVLVKTAENSKVFIRDKHRAKFYFACGIGRKIKITSSNWSTPKVHDGAVKIESLGGFLKADGKQYREELYVYSFNSDCVVVNHIDIEKYVAGVLNSEMNANWNMEALKAQAVAARTYAIYQMNEASTARYKSIIAPFDLDSSVKDQVYEGASKERYRAIKAVEATRGMVLTYSGKVIKAFYHSTCGGSTESPARVWGMKLPYLHSVKCGYCKASPAYNWQIGMTTTNLEQKLHQAKYLLGKFESIRVIKRNGIGRAQEIQVNGSLGDRVIAATKIRDLLGNALLRSTDFVITERANQVVFSGRGSGHGVGMCQWGAKVMGEQGKYYDEILGRYYPEAKLTKLY